MKPGLYWGEWAGEDSAFNCSSVTCSPTCLVVWPSVAAQWIFALYTMVDEMFVARGVSEMALSAVVAIFLGQGRRREANQANTQSTAEYVKHYILSLLPFTWCFTGA